MKIRTTLFSLTLLLIAYSQSFGQFLGQCGVNDPMPLIERVIQHQKTLAESPLQSRTSLAKYVPLTFILVADDNGSGRAVEEKALEQLEKLNTYYVSQDLHFYIDEWRYKNHTLIYEEPSNPTSVFQMKLIKDPNALNLYVTHTADTDGESPGLTLGYYSPPNDWIVIRKDRMSGFNNVLAHEAGHFFSLPHTFSGWECEAYDPDIHGNPVSSIWSPCNGSLRVEFQNGTNCSNAGDRICDTSPDYNFGFGWSVGGDQCAEYTPIVMDPNGDVVDVTENNHMGYFLDCDDYMFTPNQQSIIQTDFFSSSRAYLRTNYVPDQDAVDNAVVYNFPINGEESPSFDQVELDWEDVPGATDYLLIIARNSTFSISPQRIIVQESNYVVEALTPNVNYYWKVWPFNEGRTGAGWAETQNFHTSIASGVATIPSVDRFEVFPNPGQTKGELTVLLESLSAFDAEITLYHMTGEVAWRGMNQQILAGRETRIAITLEHTVPGLYFLKIQSSEGGVISRKVSIL